MGKKKKAKKKLPVYFYPIILGFVILLAASVAWFLLLSGEESKKANKKGPVNVLLLGNDLMVTNDVPDMVRLILKNSQDKKEKVDVQSIALPDSKYGIVNHLHSQTLAQLLRKKKDWDLVVLQDSPEEILKNPYVILTSIRDLRSKFDPEAKTRFIFVSPFTHKDRKIEQRVVSSVSRKLSKNLSLQIAPVGEVFQKSRQLLPDLEIYMNDNRQANSTGSFIMAATIYSVLTGKPLSINKIKDESVKLERKDLTRLSSLIASTVVARNRAYKLGLRLNASNSRTLMPVDKKFPLKKP